MSSSSVSSDTLAEDDDQSDGHPSVTHIASCETLTDEHNENRVVVPEIAANTDFYAKYIASIVGEKASGEKESGDPSTTAIDRDDVPEKGPSTVVVDEKHSSQSSTTEVDSDGFNEIFSSPKILDSGKDDQNARFSDEDPALKIIPWHVRRVVSLHDDTTLPTLTFRYFLLTFLFIVPGAFLAQLNEFRTTYVPYSIFFVQIGANYVGDWLATVLPAWNVKVPFTRWSFNLNPGPFSVKEHVLVTITAASGATYNLGYTAIAMSELYFGYRISPAVSIFFMWAITWTGYSYAALARQFLIYDPRYPWFQALCQTALFETQKKSRESPTPTSRRQMMVFGLVLGGVALWQFLPEFVFPFLGSLAFLCWAAPHNATANFIGSGFGGMGFLNLSLDWSNIGYLGSMGSMFLTPWWTQVVVFLAFVLNCWILLPAAKWGGLGIWHEHLMSNQLFMGTHDQNIMDVANIH